ncbi:tyrosine-type recombinase/integrase [bacterium]|nr:tyrosine-type recombinase/integrase [bacterium]
MSPRTGPRVRIGKCLYRDATGLSAVVNVGDLTRERRFPLETPRDRVKLWQDETRVALRKTVSSPTRGTFAADAARYLRAVKAMAGIDERTKQIEAWVGEIGHRYRDRIASSEIRAVLERWKEEKGWSSSTLNHYRTAVQHLWNVLDGKGEKNPVRGVPRYREPDAAPRGLPWPAVLSILRAMPPSVTRLRLAIMATTGLPHSTLGRLAHADVDLEARVYRRPGRQKGAGAVGALMPLSRRAAAYFRLLDRAGGWGPFSRGSLRLSFLRACRAAEAAAAKAGDRLDLAGVRPYDLRHSFGTAVLQATGDLQATKELLGHAALSTTLRYTRASVAPSVLEAQAKVDRITAPNRGTGKRKRERVQQVV